MITIGSILDAFKRNRELGKETEELWDLDIFGIDVEQRLYLKKSALETCVNLIGRTISLAEFRFTKDGKKQKHDFDYLLNVRPNTDETAASFWQDFIYTLLVENEILVILTDDNDLLIADSFDRNEYAIYEDTFTNVTVKNYTFKRTFKMSEVIHLTYNNEKLSHFLDGMFSDYTEMFSRMIETKMYESQIRALAGLDSTQTLDEKNRERLNKFVNRVYEKFKTTSFAIVPKLKGFEYQEVTANQNRASKSVDELDKVKKDLTGNVAQILGIPPVLVNGDMANYETAIKAYIRFCIKPLIKKLEDELKNKLIPQSEYENGLNLKIFGVAELSPLEVATAIDKLISSGTFNGDEIRPMFGYEVTGEEIHSQYFVTKNYAPSDELKGGEDD